MPRYLRINRSTNCQLAAAQMKINGRKLAQNILNSLKSRITQASLTPTLAIIQVGDNPASKSYIGIKKRVGERIGVKVIHDRLPTDSSQKRVANRIKKLNRDKAVNGIIVQLPLPDKFSTDKILNTMSPDKDIDAFTPASPYISPIAASVLHILEFTRRKIFGSVRKNSIPRASHPAPVQGLLSSYDFAHRESTVGWLREKKVVILGRGKTGGGPIIKTLSSLNISNIAVHSKTTNSEKIIAKADIVVSCIGKPNVVTPENIKRGAILISVGVHRGKDDKLYGDYDEQKIKDKAAFYTPTPGGVGPLTVAYLMHNLTQATSSKF